LTEQQFILYNARFCKAVQPVGGRVKEVDGGRTACLEDGLTVDGHLPNQVGGRLLLRREKAYPEKSPQQE
ncbi:unnamed protein product, partial [marine sediment metagenome]